MIIWITKSLCFVVFVFVSMKECTRENVSIESMFYII